MSALAWATPPAPKKAAFDANRLSNLQGVLADLVHALGLPSLEWRTDLACPAWAHPTRCLGGFIGDTAEPCAVIADLEPGLARALDLEGELASDVAVCEVSIDALLVLPPEPFPADASKFDKRYF